ncbi:hypothetical protein [Gordonia amicalis]|uniref:Uncharacterized protein n=1 Tax=Gordonia amicalis TaxID=89053 RepID=A0ABU4DFI5_9ACTN|nr:hypothetical protein [Gordonia amicalis]MDV6308513.1 hypothetical protein [Gordonia amicalis]
MKANKVYKDLHHRDKRGIYYHYLETKHGAIVPELRKCGTIGCNDKHHRDTLADEIITAEEHAYFGYKAILTLTIGKSSPTKLHNALGKLNQLPEVAKINSTLEEHGKKIKNLKHHAHYLIAISEEITPALITKIEKIAHTAGKTIDINECFNLRGWISYQLKGYTTNNINQVATFLANNKDKTKGTYKLLHTNHRHWINPKNPNITTRKDSTNTWNTRTKAVGAFVQELRTASYPSFNLNQELTWLDTTLNPTKISQRAIQIRENQKHWETQTHTEAARIAYKDITISDDIFDTTDLTKINHNAEQDLLRQLQPNHSTVKVKDLDAPHKYYGNHSKTDRYINIASMTEGEWIAYEIVYGRTKVLELIQEAMTMNINIDWLPTRVRNFYNAQTAKTTQPHPTPPNTPETRSESHTAANRGIQHTNSDNDWWDTQDETESWDDHDTWDDLYRNTHTPTITTSEQAAYEAMDTYESIHDTEEHDSGTQSAQNNQPHPTPPNTPETRSEGHTAANRGTLAQPLPRKIQAIAKLRYGHWYAYERKYGKQAVKKLVDQANQYNIDLPDSAYTIAAQAWQQTKTEATQNKPPTTILKTHHTQGGRATTRHQTLL